MAATITEQRAAFAARQLLYHRERMLWMAERMAENEAELERYLLENEIEGDVLRGGYAIETTPEGIAVTRITNHQGYEQMILPEVYA
jgi:hypothetical protein